jgi:hypothetical protein
LASKWPEGRCAKGAVDEVGEGGFDDRVLPMGEIRFHCDRFGVGEERVITPHREQCVVRVFVLHPAHDEPCGDLVTGAGEGGVNDLGDLGAFFVSRTGATMGFTRWCICCSSSCSAPSLHQCI